MLRDYKGESPKNVITEEEHKKRPFYKKVSFWVLSALGLFFGGCSVFGLVLGYQYVDAVTEAAHIIADRGDSSDGVEESSLRKPSPHLYTPSYTGTYYATEKLTLTGSLPYYWTSASNTLLTYNLVTGQYTNGSNVNYELAVSFDWQSQGSFFIVQFYNYNDLLNIDDYDIGLKLDGVTITQRYEPIVQYRQKTYYALAQYFRTGTATPFEVSLYLHPYDAGYQNGLDGAYDEGYDAGYDEGYDAGKIAGINQGEAQAVGGSKALVTMFVTAFQQPFDQIYRFLNFNVLGLNVLALFTSLLTLSIGIIIIKKVI